MRFKRANYESMLNPELLELAKSRRIILSNRQRRGLGSIRGTVEDTLGEQTRDEVIVKLQTQDNVHGNSVTAVLALLSLIVAIFALLK